MLINLYHDIVNGNYRISPSIAFVIEKPVRREVFAQPVITSELSDLVLSITQQIVMHDPVEECRINGSRSRWNELPADKSLFGANHIAMPNGYLNRSDGNDEPRAKGLPIGNLTSQWFGNFYLNSLDHFIKHTLGVRYYGRYVDDFVIIHTDFGSAMQPDKLYEL